MNDSLENLNPDRSHLSIQGKSFENEKHLLKSGDSNILQQGLNDQTEESKEFNTDSEINKLAKKGIAKNNTSNPTSQEFLFKQEKTGSYNQEGFLLETEHANNLPLLDEGNEDDQGEIVDEEPTGWDDELNFVIYQQLNHDHKMLFLFGLNLLNQHEVGDGIRFVWNPLKLSSFGFNMQYLIEEVSQGSHTNASAQFDIASSLKRGLFDLRLHFQLFGSFGLLTFGFSFSLRALWRRVKGYYTEGETYLETGELDHARNFALRILEKDKNDTKANLLLGRILLVEGMFEEALLIFHKITEFAPDSIEGLLCKGVALTKLLRFQEATSVLAKAVDLDPKNVEALFNYGLMLIGQKKKCEAVETFRKILIIDSKNSDASQMLEVLSKKISLDDQVFQLHPILSFIKARILRTQGDNSNAIRMFDEAIQTFSNYPIFYFYLADTHRIEKNFNKARSRLEEGIKNHQECLLLYLLLGTILKDSDDNNDCQRLVDVLEKANTLNPGDGDILIELGQALIKKGRYCEAISKFKEAVEVVPGRAKIYYLWGQALFYQRKYSEAIFQLERAATFRCNDCEIYKLWGHALLKQNKFSESESKLKKAIAIDQKNIEAYKLCIKALSKQGKWDEVDEMKRIVKLIRSGFPNDYEEIPATKTETSAFFLEGINLSA